MKQKLIFCAPEQAIASLPSDAWIITDQNVERAWGHLLSAHRVISFKPGEEQKTWAQTGLVLEELASKGVNRKSTIAALGGGVVGDLAGFAASSILRGIRLVQIPTSLLAMVDSAIGGKVGVDLEAGKNLAGAFWPADEVLICVDFLKTLPEREWLCGSAEVWKYGAIMDEKLFSDLESANISPQRPDLGRVVAACANHKVDVVEEDPHEKTGRRAILNYGHTIGHAIEWAAGYGAMTHGEAISIGMVLEAHLGEILGVTESGTSERMKSALSRQGLPVQLPDDLSPNQLLEGMKRDKKAGADGLAFSLLNRIGESKLYTAVPAEPVLEILKKT